MPEPIVLRRTYIEEKPGRLTAVFLLSAQPDPLWIAHFRMRAVRSVFDVAAAEFFNSRIRIELAHREDLALLIYSVQRFIEGANVDADLPALS